AAPVTSIRTCCIQISAPDDGARCYRLVQDMVHQRARADQPATSPHVIGRRIVAQTSRFQSCCVCSGPSEVGSLPTSTFPVRTMLCLDSGLLGAWLIPKRKTSGRA